MPINKRSLCHNKTREKQVWSKDQQAIIFLKSTKKNKTKLKNNKPQTHNISTKPTNHNVKLNNKINKNLKIPIKPHFKTTLANKQLNSVEASTWHSGNQECNGHRGYLIQKAKNKKNHKNNKKNKLSTKKNQNKT